MQHWTYKLLKVIWGTVRKLWDIFLGFEHGVTLSQQRHNKHQKLLQELLQVYQKRDEVQYTDQNQFYESPEEHLRIHKSTSQVKTWITLMKKTITASIPCAKDTATNRVSKLQKYFPLKQSSLPIKQKYPRRSKRKSKKKTHQTYLYINHTSQKFKYQCSSTIVSHELSPRQIQPWIPWQGPKLYQSSISTYLK